MEIHCFKAPLQQKNHKYLEIFINFFFFSGGGGSGAGSPASNAYMSGAPHEPSSHHHRPTVGIMGNRMIRKEQREPSHIRSSELHRDLERANIHRQSSLSDNDGPPPHHSSRGMSPPPDQHHGFAFPTSR